MMIKGTTDEALKFPEMVPKDMLDKNISSDLQDLCQRFWTWRLRDAPEIATTVGFHKYDDLLDDMSLAAYEDRRSHCEKFLEEAMVLESHLTRQVDIINLKALKETLLTYINGFPHKAYMLPLNYMEGPQVDFIRLVSRMTLETPENFEQLLSRYEQLPVQLSQIKALLQEGVTAGIVTHAISMRGVGDSFDKYVVNSAEESPLWAPFATIPATIAQDQVDDIQSRAAHIIKEKISPSFLELKHYVEKEYVTRPDTAVTSLPGGHELYQQLIRFHASTDLSPREIHEIGMEEVARIQKCISQVVEELGYDMSLTEFFSMIRNDSRFYYENSDDLLAFFKDLTYNKVFPRIPDMFNNIPKMQMRVEKSPVAGGPVASYTAGTIDGTRPGVVYVSTHDPSVLPKYELLTLSLHEGSPGHHMQNSHALESSSLPAFRRVTEDRYHGTCPSRFPANTAYKEGWALYAEKLGFDMSLYGDPYDRYGHYAEELFRACRLVVDTGLHALDWSPQEAVDYLLSHTAVSEVKAQREVARYITRPAQALGYKMGQLKISQLRDTAARHLGTRFDIKKFHHVVLECIGGLNLVEEAVQAWITAHTHT